MSLAESYKRWRHTRGFGVHSPLAWFVLTDIVRLPKTYSYYKELEIRHLASSGKELADALILHRLASRFRFQGTYVSGGEALPKAIKEALRHLRIVKKKSDLSRCLVYIPDAKSSSVNLAEVAEAEDAAVLCRNLEPETITQMLEAQKEGVAFYGKHSVLLINRSNVAKVSYSIRL